MNRKFILIGLLLGACFAFTVLQAATGEAQQCDPNPACVENCCGQCDPNPACVMDDPNAIPCCSSEGNDMSSGTPPQRGSAPPEHDEMSHDRVPQHKMGGKLREKLEECRPVTKTEEREVCNQQPITKTEEREVCQQQPKTEWNEQRRQMIKKMQTVCTKQPYNVSEMQTVCTKQLYNVSVQECTK